MTPRPARDPRDAFEEMYRSTRSNLLRYLVRRCGDAEETAELLAETYLTAWRKLDTLPADGSARLWLYGVARNLLLRSAHRRRVADALVGRLAGELHAAQTSTPDEEWRCDALRLALADLSERDREILTLTAWEGLSPREIARVLGTSANIVRIRLHRARARIKKQLDASDEALPSPQSDPVSRASELISISGELEA